MWKDHAAPAPIMGWMWLDAGCRIVHTQLLSQGQRNALLLQVGVGVVPRVGALEGSEERGEGGTRGSGLVQCWGVWRTSWLLLRMPLCLRRFHRALGITSKGCEAAAMRPHRQIEFVVGAVKEAHRTAHVTTFANERLAVRKANKKKNISGFFKVTVGCRISHLWRTKDGYSGLLSLIIIEYSVFLASSMFLRETARDYDRLLLPIGGFVGFGM
jgi:hypothetical protein